MHISILIPNYNGKQLLQTNLQKIVSSLESKNHTIEIIISDDNSTDGSDEYIQKYSAEHSSKQIKIIGVKNTSGRGFAINVNYAAQFATGEILLLLNTDIIPDKNFLEPLLTHFSNPKVFAVGCLEKTEDHGKPVSYGRSLGRFVGGFIQHEARNSDGDTTFWVSCGSGAFRKSIWTELGGLDEIYSPFYWEDIDLSYRAVKSGYTIVFEAKSIVYHNHESGAIKSHFSPLFIKKIAYRNQFIFLWKNITDVSMIKRHIVFLPFVLCKAIYRGDTAFLVGFFNAMFLIPNIIQLRGQEKRKYVLSDAEVLQRQYE